MLPLCSMLLIPNHCRLRKTLVRIGAVAGSSKWRSLASTETEKPYRKPAASLSIFRQRVSSSLNVGEPRKTMSKRFGSSCLRTSVTCTPIPQRLQYSNYIPSRGKDQFSGFGVSQTGITLQAIWVFLHLTREIFSIFGLFPDDGAQRYESVSPVLAIFGLFR